MDKRKLKAGFARAAHDPEMIELAEACVEYVHIPDSDMAKWAKKFIEKYRDDLEKLARE